MIALGLLLVGLVLVGGIAWAIHEAPAIDERRCSRRYLLEGGQCGGPCERLPPCSLDVEVSP